MNQPTEPISQSLSTLVLMESQNARLANDIFRSHGFEIKETGDAASVGELCQHSRFDLGVYDDSVHGAMEMGGSGTSHSLSARHKTRP